MTPEAKSAFWKIAGVMAMVVLWTWFIMYAADASAKYEMQGKPAEWQEQLIDASEGRGLRASAVFDGLTKTYTAILEDTVSGAEYRATSANAESAILSVLQSSALARTMKPAPSQTTPANPEAEKP